LAEGNLHEARRAYTACEHLLDQELGVPPTSAMTTLLSGCSTRSPRSPGATYWVHRPSPASSVNGNRPECSWDEERTDLALPSHRASLRERCVPPSIGARISAE
jgi:hypothetical protein